MVNDEIQYTDKLDILTNPFGNKQCHCNESCKVQTNLTNTINR